MKAIWCFLFHSPLHHYEAQHLYHPWIKPHAWVMRCRKCGHWWMER